MWSQGIKHPPGVFDPLRSSAPGLSHHTHVLPASHLFPPLIRSRTRVSLPRGCRFSFRLSLLQEKAILGIYELATSSRSRHIGPCLKNGLMASWIRSHIHHPPIVLHCVPFRHPPCDPVSHHHCPVQEHQRKALCSPADDVTALKSGTEEGIKETVPTSSLKERFASFQACGEASAS